MFIKVIKAPCVCPKWHFLSHSRFQSICETTGCSPDLWCQAINHRNQLSILLHITWHTSPQQSILYLPDGVTVHCPLKTILSLFGGSGFFLTCEDLRKMFNYSFLLAFFFKVEISWCTLIPLFMPGSVHSGSACWDDCGQIFPYKLCVSSFPDRFPHYA